MASHGTFRKYDEQEIANREHDDSLALKKVMPYGWNGSVAVALPVDSSGNLKIDPTGLDTTYLKLDQSTPQTISNGIPLLEETRVIDQEHELVDKEYVDTAVTAGINDVNLFSLMVT